MYFLGDLYNKNIFMSLKILQKKSISCALSVSHVNTTSFQVFPQLLDICFSFLPKDEKHHCPDSLCIFLFYLLGMGYFVITLGQNNLEERGIIFQHSILASAHACMGTHKCIYTILRHPHTENWKVLPILSINNNPLRKAMGFFSLFILSNVFHNK